MQTQQKSSSFTKTLRSSGAMFFLGVALSATAFAGAGEDTFKAKCVACHGADAGGSTPMGKKFKLRDLRGPDVQKQSDADLQTIIAKGKPPMPGFDKSLDAAKIQEVVVYLRSIKN